MIAGRGASGVLLLAALLFGAPVAAQAPLSEADRAAVERIDGVLRDFDRRGLPTELLRAKVAEGTAKGAPPSRIADAVTLLAKRVDSVARLLAPTVTVPELHAGAEALSVGITGPSLRSIRSAAGRQPAELYIQFVVRLVRRGVSPEQAVRATRALIDRHVAGNTLLAVSDDLARDVASGMSPEAALNDRLTRLVGGGAGGTMTADFGGFGTNSNGPRCAACATGTPAAGNKPP